MGRFELWDVLCMGRLVMGCFESGTFSDGTFCMCIYNSLSMLITIHYFFCSRYSSSSCLIVYFLCRLKINPDSNEFILKFGTVANRNN